MRDLLYKNLTSLEKKRRIIVSSEIVDKAGVRNIIHRHFIYIIREIDSAYNEKEKPSLYVLRETNTKNKMEKFFCRMKGNILITRNKKIYIIYFMHSLKIQLIHQESISNH